MNPKPEEHTSSFPIENPSIEPDHGTDGLLRATFSIGTVSTYDPSNEANKFYVQCPYKSGHTDGKSGKTDAYVFGDASGWAFNCSHTSCKQAGRTTWDSFREGMKIPRREHSSRRRTNKGQAENPTLKS